MRLYQARDPQVEKGKRLGDNDWHVNWNRPLKAPQGRFTAMHKAIHTALPATLDLRLVKVRTTSPGFLTQELQIITTLQDTLAHSAAWYQLRWQVELCLDDIKTRLHMHALR